MDLDEEMLKWSQTVYGVAHALHIAKSINFGNLNTVLESLRSAETWNSSTLGFESGLPVKEFAEGSIRLDGNSHDEVFARVSENIVRILFINLAVIADESLGYLIEQLGAPDVNYLINKVEWAKARIDQRAHWAANGMLEMVAIRNALVHNDARWNNNSVAILKKAGIQEVDSDIELSLSFGDLFRYRRALRTLIGELRKQTTL